MSNEIMPSHSNEEIVTTPEELLMGAKTVPFSTLPATTDPVEMAKQINYINNIDFSLNDEVNKTISLVDIICQNVQVRDMNAEDPDKAELLTRPRTIVIDSDGKTHATTSPSFVQALATIFQTMGKPHYETPLPIAISKPKSNNGFQFLTANVDVKSPLLKEFKVSK